MSRISKSIQALALVAALPSCMRLDVFVFMPKAVDDPNADLMATSVVPPALRQELKTEIVSTDATKVSAWLLKHEATDGTPAARHGRGVLYCHGNNTHIGTTVPRVDQIWKLGYTVLVFDARGWGKTQGTQTETGVFADVAAARTYLEGQVGGADHVGLYGRSLGTALCTHEAVARTTKALVLESPISSVQTIIDDSVGLETPSEWYADSTLDNPIAIGGFTGGLFIMHGAEDDYVQPAYGELIHERAVKANPNDFWLVPGADHGNVPCVGEGTDLNDCEGGFKPEYLQKVSAFFDRQLGIDG